MKLSALFRQWNTQATVLQRWTACFVILLVGLTVASKVFAQTTTSTSVNATSTAATTSTAPTAAPAQNGDGGMDASSGEAGQLGTYEEAAVLDVHQSAQTSGGISQNIEVYKLHFTSGPLKNQDHEIVNEVGTNPYNLKLHRGDKVVVLIQTGPDGSQNLFIEGYDRRAAMIALLLLFVFVMVLLSGWQGFKVALSIIVSIALIGWVLIPTFLRGVNPIPVAILLSGVLAFLSTGFSTGWNRKSVITAIGTVGGALIALLIADLFANWSNMNGLSSDDDRLFFDKNPLLNPRGLMFAGIIIASTGVVEDVAVSIASGVSEVKRANPKASFRDLFRSGMVIGNDHMSALANTLVFAYVGGSLSTLLLYTQFGGSWLKFINFDTVVSEIIRSLAGTIGLVFTVPITALLAAWVSKPEEDSQPHHHIH